MIAYFDTSALVKIVIEEDESELASRVWAGADNVLTGELTYPEARAAVAAAYRAGRLQRRALEAAVRLIEELMHQASLVRLDRTIAWAAGDLTADQDLRGYDAVHLATALASGAGAVVTWDRDLGRAALACGMAVVPGFAAS